MRDKTCRAEGCDTPGTWCEAHHLDPWQPGGPTDLDNGVLLCHHHHHRIHDPAYRTERLPNGDHRFHRRR
ncbi:HNH endonuclease signature motif containing protein [uncultured Nocardioides sp.]|uniref:HNH endonuclease signature motif containing protein n=1 Tax=uncultured Nocardioides sp. TaxID=198441 RepID=UPI003457326A